MSFSHEQQVLLDYHQTADHPLQNQNEGSQTAVSKNGGVSVHPDTYFKAAQTLQMPSYRSEFQQNLSKDIGNENADQIINSEIGHVSSQVNVEPRSYKEDQMLSSSGYSNTLTRNEVASQRVIAVDRVDDKNSALAATLETAQNIEYLQRDLMTNTVQPIQTTRKSLNIQTYQVKEAQNQTGISERSSNKVLLQNRGSPTNLVDSISPLPSCDDLKITTNPKPAVTATSGRSQVMMSGGVNGGGLSPGQHTTTDSDARGRFLRAVSSDHQSVLMVIAQVEEQAIKDIKSKRVHYQLTNEQTKEHNRGKQRLIKSLVYGRSRQKSLQIGSQVITKVRGNQVAEHRGSQERRQVVMANQIVTGMAMNEKGQQITIQTQSSKLQDQTTLSPAAFQYPQKLQIKTAQYSLKMSPSPLKDNSVMIRGETQLLSGGVPTRQSIPFAELKLGIDLKQTQGIDDEPLSSTIRNQGQINGDIPSLELPLAKNMSDALVGVNEADFKRMQEQSVNHTVMLESQEVSQQKFSQRGPPTAETSNPHQTRPPFIKTDKDGQIAAEYQTTQELKLVMTNQNEVDAAKQKQQPKMFRQLETLTFSNRQGSPMTAIRPQSSQMSLLKLTNQKKLQKQNIPFVMIQTTSSPRGLNQTTPVINVKTEISQAPLEDTEEKFPHTSHSQQKLLADFLTSHKQNFYKEGQNHKIQASKNQNRIKSPKTNKAKKIDKVQVRLMDIMNSQNSIKKGEFSNNVLQSYNHESAYTKFVQSSTGSVSSQQKEDQIILHYGESPRQKSGAIRKQQFVTSTDEFRGKSSLVSTSLVQYQQRHKGNAIEDKTTSQTKLTRHFRNSSKVASSLQEEQIIQSKLLNPWSNVLGGQSRRYFKSKQFQRYDGVKSGSGSVALSLGSPINSTDEATIRQPGTDQNTLKQSQMHKTVDDQRFALSGPNRIRVSTAPQSPPNCGGFYRSQYDRRRQTYVVQANAKNLHQMVDKADDTKDFCPDLEPQNREYREPSTMLQGHLLNGIMQSRRSQEENQTHIRLPIQGQETLQHVKRLQSQAQKRRMISILTSHDSGSVKGGQGQRRRPQTNQVNKRANQGASRNGGSNFNRVSLGTFQAKGPDVKGSYDLDQEYEQLQANFGNQNSTNQLNSPVVEKDCPRLSPSTADFNSRTSLNPDQIQKRGMQRELNSTKMIQKSFVNPPDEGLKVSIEPNLPENNNLDDEFNADKTLLLQSQRLSDKTFVSNKRNSNYNHTKTQKMKSTSTDMMTQNQISSFRDNRKQKQYDMQILKSTPLSTIGSQKMTSRIINSKNQIVREPTKTFDKSELSSPAFIRNQAFFETTSNFKQGKNEPNQDVSNIIQGSGQKRCVQRRQTAPFKAGKQINEFHHQQRSKNVQKASVAVIECIRKNQKDHEKNLSPTPQSQFAKKMSPKNNAEYIAAAAAAAEEKTGNNVQMSVMYYEHESPLPRKVAMPVSEYSFGDPKSLRVNQGSSQIAANSHLRQSRKVAHHKEMIYPKAIQVKLVQQKQDQSTATFNQQTYTAPQFKTNNVANNMPFFTGKAMPGMMRNSHQSRDDSPNFTNQIPNTASNRNSPYASNSPRQQRIMDIKLRMTNISHPSIYDEKSSLIGAPQGSLRPKYSESMSQSPGPSKPETRDHQILNSLNKAINLQTAISGRMQSQYDQPLLKPKHFSQLYSPVYPSIIPETEDIYDIKRKLQMSSRHQQQSNQITQIGVEDAEEFECDNKVDLFASDIQLNSDRSQLEHELTNLKLGNQQAFKHQTQLLTHPNSIEDHQNNNSPEEKEKQQL